MLLSYFLERRESGGALVQAVGAVTNIVVLSQVADSVTVSNTICISLTAFPPLSSRGLWDPFGCPSRGERPLLCNVEHLPSSNAVLLKKGAASRPAKDLA